MPKSSTFTRSPPGDIGSGTRNRFSGLRSRWTISIACDAATARAAWIAMSTALPTPSRSRASRRDSGSPSRNSIMMYGTSFSTMPTSITSMTFG